MAYLHPVVASAALEDPLYYITRVVCHQAHEKEPANEQGNIYENYSHEESVRG